MSRMRDRRERRETVSVAVCRRPIKLSLPGEHQKRVLRSPARNKVLMCGRRWGKTSLGLIAAIAGHGPTNGALPGAVHGAHIAWVVPAFPSVVEVWRDLKEATARAWRDKSEMEHRIELLTGGVILVRSGEDPDSLRGFRFDGALRDEAASHKPEVWSQALAPALSDSRGWSMHMGTPKGIDNAFSELFMRVPDLPDWERWQRPSSDNPLMTPDELAARRAEVGSFAFAREYEAQLVAAGGGLFQRDSFKFYDRIGDACMLDGAAHSPETMYRFATCDLAATTKTYSDYTCIATWGLTRDGKLVLLDLVREKLDGAEILATLAQVVGKWSLGSVWIEKTAYHALLISEARAQQIPVLELVADKDKVTRAEPAAAMMEGGLVYFPRHAPWLDSFLTELLAFPDDGSHDDQVDAFSYAVAVARGRRRGDDDVGGGGASRSGAPRLPSLAPGRPPSLRPGR